MKAFSSRQAVWLWLVLALALLALLAAPLPARAADRLPGGAALVPPSNYGASCVYVVLFGDDLYRISLRFGMPVYGLMLMNGMYNPGWVYAGMRMRVPCASVYAAPIYSPSYYTSPMYSSRYYPPASYSSYPGGSVCAYHYVYFGEYLLLIARRYGVSWQSIAALNRLYNPNLIFAGMRLAIPCASRAYSSNANPYSPNANPYAPSTNPYMPGMNPYAQPPAATPAPTMQPGQTTNVTIADFMFSPASITIHAGQTVVWRNNGPSAHTSTSDAGLWDSGSLAPGATFSHTFTTTGTFQYHCAIHPMMRGTIVVVP